MRTEQVFVALEACLTLGGSNERGVGLGIYSLAVRIKPKLAHVEPLSYSLEHST
jgi:hypothetical protein